MKYINKNYLDVLYDYYNLNKNIAKIYNYGFYYKFKDQFINYVINGNDTIYILSYQLLNKYTNKIGNKNVLYTNINLLNNKYQNIYDIYKKNVYVEIDNILNIKYTRIKKNIPLSFPLFNNSTYYVCTYQNNTFYYLKCNPTNYDANYNNVSGTSDIDKFGLVKNHLDTNSSKPTDPTIFKIKYNKNTIRFIPFLESNSLINNYSHINITNEYNIFYSNNKYQIKNPITGKNLSIRNDKLLFDTKNNFIWNLIPIETFYRVINSEKTVEQILSSNILYNTMPREEIAGAEVEISSNSNYIFSLYEYIQFKQYKTKKNKIEGAKINFTRYIKNYNKYHIDFSKSSIIKDDNSNSLKLYISMIQEKRYRSMTLEQHDGSNNKNLFNINQTSKFKYVHKVNYL